MRRTDEAQHLFNAIDFTIGVILRSDADDLNRIAFAYREAQCLADTIPLAPGNADARPRIVACVNRFEALKAADDISFAGWMLMAVQLRLNERNLVGWEPLLARRRARDRTAAISGTNTALEGRCIERSEIHAKEMEHPNGRVGVVCGLAALGGSKLTSGHLLLPTASA